MATMTNIAMTTLVPERLGKKKWKIRIIEKN
jgi:hypothetical protein